MHIRGAGLPLPELEYRFRGLSGRRRWRWDFAWPAQGVKVAVEVQGATWTFGAHSRGAGQRNDCCKLVEGQLCGWTVLQVTSDMISDGTALAYIERAFNG